MTAGGAPCAAGVTAWRPARIEVVAESDIHVTLNQPEIAGTYVVSEQHDDGSLVLRPTENQDGDPKAPYRAIVERHRETFDRLAQ